MSIFSDINKVEIMGNVTKDPEVRYTQSGTAVCTISVATNRSYKQNDEWVDESQFHEVVLWGKLAEHAGARLQKGTRVLITGRLQTRKWEDKEGNTRYKTEIVADDMILIRKYKGKVKDGEEQSVDDVFDDMPDAPAEESKVEEDPIGDEDLPF